MEETMEKKCWLFVLAAGVLLLGGCGEDAAENNAGQTQPPAAESEQEEKYLSAQDDVDVATIIAVYSEDEEYPQLAQFLAEHYEIPEEYLDKTRYYYNYTDLNEDGQEEIFAVVVGEYTKQPSGYPAVILQKMEDDTFGIIEDFAGIQTPVTIYDTITNGWHEFVYYGHGADEQDGYRICRYNPDGGYQTDLSEIADKVEPVNGTQILSDNLIDDMDRGDYLTLAPKDAAVSE